MKSEELTPDQIALIKTGTLLGRTLQKEHPEIADFYRDLTHIQIVDHLNIQSVYGVGENVSRLGVQKAIAGHDGSLGVDAYDGLLNSEERERITIEHRIKEGRKGGLLGGSKGGKIGGRKGGRKIYEESIGIFGRTTQQRIEDARKGGKVSGRRAYENRKGYHARTKEQMIADGRKSAIARGRVPWTEEEIVYTYELSQLPEYQRGTNVDRKKIAKELNEKWHNKEMVRTANAISQILNRYKLSLEEKVE